MPPGPVVVVVQDINYYSVTDAEVTTHGLDLIPTVLKPPLSARNVLAN